MRHSISCSFIGVIAWACVAAASVARQASAADLRNYEATPIKAPECVADTTGYFYSEQELAPDPATAVPKLTHFYFVVRNLGANAVSAAPTYDFGRLPTDYPYPPIRGAALTGLTVPEPRQQWQRSTRVNSTADDSSAFQIHCYDAGSFINTWTFPYVEVPGSSPHSIYGYDFNDPGPRPVFDDNPSTDLVLQVSLEVPWIALWPSPTTGEMPVAQVSLFAYFRDRTTGKPFAILLLLFDNRLGATGTFPVQISDDLRTPFIGIPLNSGARFSTLSPYSASATGIPWTGLRFFRSHITQGNFREMLLAINDYCREKRIAPFCEASSSSANAFSDDVKDYEITMFGVIHEVSVLPDSNISMGLHLYDLGVWNFR